MSNDDEAQRQEGSPKGAYNKGYFFRAGRGWGTRAEGKFVALTTETGERLKDKNTPPTVVAQAYARHRLTRKDQPKPTGPGATVQDVVNASTLVKLGK